jgi:hypothetical protein
LLAVGSNLLEDEREAQLGIPAANEG